MVSNVMALETMAMTDDDLSRSLGRLEGKLEQIIVRQDERHHENIERFDDLKYEIAHMHECVEEMKTSRATLRGAWKVIVFIGGAAGATLGFLSPYLRKLLGLAS